MNNYKIMDYCTNCNRKIWTFGICTTCSHDPEITISCKDIEYIYGISELQLHKSGLFHHPNNRITKTTKFLVVDVEFYFYKLYLAQSEVKRKSFYERKKHLIDRIKDKYERAQIQFRNIKKDIIELLNKYNIVLLNDNLQKQLQNEIYRYFKNDFTDVLAKEMQIVNNMVEEYNKEKKKEIRKSQIDKLIDENIQEKKRPGAKLLPIYNNFIENQHMDINNTLKMIKQQLGENNNNNTNREKELMDKLSDFIPSQFLDRAKEHRLYNEYISKDSYDISEVVIKIGMYVNDIIYDELNSQ